MSRNLLMFGIFALYPRMNMIIVQDKSLFILAIKSCLASQLMTCRMTSSTARYDFISRTMWGMEKTK